MNWKLSVYRFLEKNFNNEVYNSITINNTEIRARFTILTQEDIVKIATAIKNSRSLFTAEITDRMTGGLLVIFTKR